MLTDISAVERCARSIDGVITANSVTDIYFVARKVLEDAKTREAVYNLMTVCSVSFL